MVPVVFAVAIAVAVAVVVVGRVAIVVVAVVVVRVGFGGAVGVGGAVHRWRRRLLLSSKLVIGGAMTAAVARMGLERSWSRS